tara:strand:+ start:235 stop:555 length:321 start_codon:yes stop_codon:yes gene_type:complete
VLGVDEVGDYWANLDGLIFKFTDNFFFAFNKGKYAQSADIVYVMNYAYPLPARITDLKRFGIGKGNMYGDEIQQEAYEYSIRTMSLLQQSMSDYRTDNQDQYQNRL